MTTQTIPAHALTPGLVIRIDGRSATVEDTLNHTYSVWVLLRFDGDTENRASTLPRDMNVELVHQTQFDAWQARQQAQARQLDATFDRFTQGDWAVYANDCGIGVYVSLPGVADVAVCSGRDSQRSREEELANAHLIAAAPELLAALKGQLQMLRQAYYQSGPEGDRNFEDANADLLALVAKAEGQSK